MMEQNDIFNRINEGILTERYSAFCRNLGKNMEYIKRNGGLSKVIPRFKNKDIIIAGAGPSLDDDIESLKKYQYRDEIIIISTDMALSPLVRRGISPAFVISCETTPVDYFSALPTERMHLLAFSCMSNSNLRKWKGDISFYNWMIYHPQYKELWSSAGDLGFVATGSIVTTQAVSLALGSGIRSLVLIGNDMAFGTEYYARNTVVMERCLASSSRLMPLESGEFNAVWRRREYKIKRGDRFYYTGNQFLAAKMWLEELFGNIKIPIYDCSRPGCSEKFVNKKGLKNFLDRFERHSHKKRR